MHDLSKSMTYKWRAALFGVLVFESSRPGVCIVPFMRAARVSSHPVPLNKNICPGKAWWETILVTVKDASDPIRVIHLIASKGGWRKVRTFREVRIWHCTVEVILHESQRMLVEASLGCSFTRLDRTCLSRLEQMHIERNL
jgi:hypothetical protein